MYIYIYIYIYVCVCVCVYRQREIFPPLRSMPSPVLPFL